MPQLDRLLSVMVSQRATALKLHESELAELEIAGAPRPMTKTALTSQQVVSLLREIAPADAAARLDAGQATQFDYVSEDGAFCIDAARDGAQWRARVTLDERRERQRLNGHPRPDIPQYAAPTPTAAAPAAAHPPAPPAPASPAAVVAPPPAASDGDAVNAFPGSERARAA
ncbi:MAG TPA: hypothetical protein VFN38_18935, partial [Gemmatimonadaceae bacterium]|nr:hypothetical protein [Gemmatimonadaceae bacterium]